MDDSGIKDVDWEIDQWPRVNLCDPQQRAESFLKK
jgi:hypothetical protein